MALKMETDSSRDVVILHCGWTPCVLAARPLIRERVKNILLGTQQMVVNLIRRDYIDSGGLGVNLEPSR